MKPFLILVILTILVFSESCVFRKKDFEKISEDGDINEVIERIVNETMSKTVPELKSGIATNLDSISKLIDRAFVDSAVLGIQGLAMAYGSLKQLMNFGFQQISGQIERTPEGATATKLWRDTHARVALIYHVGQIEDKDRRSHFPPKINETLEVLETRFGHVMAEFANKTEWAANELAKVPRPTAQWWAVVHRVVSTVACTYKILH